MKRWLSIILIVSCAVTCVAAQDSIYAGISSDTIRMQDMPAAVDMDQLLLQLVAEQTVRLHEQDTVPALTAAIVLYRDSMAKVEQAYHDSLLMAQRELDSLKQAVEQLEAIAEKDMPMAVERSIIKDTEEDRAAVLRAIRDRKSPWRKEATVMLQLTQNYVSPNWYQGGNSSFAMLGIAKGSIGYYSDRFTWENTGEFRAGFSTISGDSLHKVNTTDDQLRLYSKAGYRVYDKLYVMANADYEMHFFPTFKENSKEIKSGFASPLKLNMSIGLDYRPVEGLSIIVSPFNYKMVHVMDTLRMRQTDFSVPVGQRTLNDVGSSIRVEYLWKPVREVQLETKFFFYTNYRRVELDLEVNCDFIINRYFSARVMLHPRYDNTVIYLDDEKAKIQFKELLSIGFAHKFR